MLKTKSSYFLLILLTILTLSLRFNIGEYPYTKDEASSLLYIKKGTNTFSKEFVLEMKRPPFTYQLAQVMVGLGADIDNEFVMRLPYALAGTLSVIVLYLYINRIVNNQVAAFLGSLVFATNGFSLALGKIVQYQSFVMLFSVLTLYLLHYYKERKLFKYLLFGAVSFSVGFMFHWDIILVAPIAVYYVISAKKKEHYLPLVLSSLPLFVLYILPYFLFNKGGAVSDSYLTSRLDLKGFDFGDRLSKYNYFFGLYNPFVFTAFYVACLFITIPAVFKKPFEYAWFVLITLLYFVVVNEPGSHIYNLLIPFSISLSIFISFLFDKAKSVGVVFSLLLVPLLVFFHYQSHMIFVDLKDQYPYQQENFSLIKKKTEKYDHGNSSRYMVGFPSDKYFEEARDYLRANYEDYDEFTFITNENEKIAEFYLDLSYDKSDKMFIFAVKDPTTFVTDVRYGEYKGKKEVVSFKNQEGRSINKVYEWYKNSQ